MGYSLTQNYDEIKIDVDINDINYQNLNLTKTKVDDDKTLEVNNNLDANEMGVEPQLEAKGLSQMQPQTAAAPSGQIQKHTSKHVQERR